MLAELLGEMRMVDSFGELGVVEDSEVMRRDDADRRRVQETRDDEARRDTAFLRVCAAQNLVDEIYHGRSRAIAACLGGENDVAKAKRLSHEVRHAVRKRILNT